MKINRINAYFIFLICCPTYSLAQERIEITVVAPDKAMAVGYKVEGKKIGGLGRTYSGNGPINKEYYFGYRNNPFNGDDIHCGKVVLTKSTHVKLIADKSRCHIVLY